MVAEIIIGNDYYGRLVTREILKGEEAYGNK